MFNKPARRPGDERGKFPLEGSLGMDRGRGGRLPRFDSARGPGYNGATKNLVMVMLCGWQPLIRRKFRSETSDNMDS